MNKKKRIISVDIGGTNSRFAIIDENYKIHKKIIKKTIIKNREPFVNLIIEGIKEIVEGEKDLLGISLGVPGPIINEEHIITMPNIKIEDLPLGSILKKEFKMPVVIRNDAEMAGFAEAKFGQGKKHSRVFFITISTGLGGALIVDQTFDETPYEIGHTPYTHLGLAKSYEYFASGNGLVNLAALYDLKIKDSEQFFQLILKKDKKALVVYHIWLEILSDFLTYIDQKYKPNLYVLTGGVFHSKEYFWRDLINLNPQLDLKECYFQDEAGLIGAAAYGFQRLK